MNKTKFMKLMAVVVVIFVCAIAVERTVHHVEAKNSEMSNSKNGGFGHYGSSDLGTSQDEFDFDDFSEQDFSIFFHDDTALDRSNMNYCVGGSDETEQFVFHYRTLEEAQEDYRFYSEELGFNVILRATSPPETMDTYGSFDDIYFIEYMCDNDGMNSLY